jgi:hypothetical protein
MILVERATGRVLASGTEGVQMPEIGVQISNLGISNTIFMQLFPGYFQ